MKKNVSIGNLFGWALGLAVAGFLMIPVASYGQEKGGTALMKLNTIKTADDLKTIEPGDMIVMSCPKCKSSWATIVQPPSHAGSPPDLKTVERHQCPGCGAEMVMKGAGRSGTAKIVHVCKECGSKSAFCCVLKKGALPTPGMTDKNQ